MEFTNLRYNEFGLILADLDGEVITFQDGLNHPDIAELANGGTIKPYEQEDDEMVFFVRAGDLWERLTNDEAEQVEAAISTQPIRIQNIFRARTEYHSDHELFPLLTEIAETLFGAERASEILAPSV